MTNLCRALPPEDLVAWTDGELARDDAERVSAHVASCSACAHEAELLRRTGDLVAAMPHAAAPAGFEGRVVDATRSQATSGRLFRIFSTRTWPRAAAAAAVLVAAAGGTLWLARGRPPEDGLTAREEEAIAADLYLLANLDALATIEADELAQIADDLDVLEASAETNADDGREGG